MTLLDNSPVFRLPNRLVDARRWSRKKWAQLFSVYCVVAGGIGLATADTDVSPQDKLKQAYSELQTTRSQALGTIVDSKLYRDFPHSRDDAYLFLLNLESAQTRFNQRYNNPEFPRYYWRGGIDNNWGFSNPDEQVLSARISDRYAYQITGRLGTAKDVVFTSYKGERTERIAGEQLARKAIKVRRGNIDIVVSREKLKGRNWLPMQKGATHLEIRQLFTDWGEQRSGVFRIRRIDLDNAQSSVAMYPPVSPEHNSERATLEYISDLEVKMLDELEYWLGVSSRFAWIPENYVAQARPSPTKITRRWLSPGRYKLSEDQAMIITFDKPSGASYMGWSLYNIWGMALDYITRQTSLNNSQLRQDNDGRYRVVLSVKDPQLPNWLDISNYPDGYIMWRTDGVNQPEQPLVRVVDFASLRRHLPIETAVTLPEQRISTIEERQKHNGYRLGH